MSCPDWTALTGWRDDRRGMEPEGWSEALAHFDGGCQLCRKGALKSDPTLVFRRLAQVPAVSMTGDQERAEADSMRQAVAAMRAASRLEKESRRGFGFLPAAAGGWKRWSAAAALALVAVTVPSHDTRLRKSPVTAEVLEQPARQMENGPVLEGGVDLPGSRVYQMGDEELAVVMVFNESFDESFGG